jgi:uncharacterized protein (TIGR02391 family)
MAVRPTLSKSELKKMFLRVLYELQYGKMKAYSWGTGNIVPYWMNEYFKMSLSPEETQLTFEGIQELKTSGIITKDSTQFNDAFQILTTKGKEIVEKQQDPDVFALRLEEVLRNQELLLRCLDSFNSGSYELAVFNAFKLVEETVRTKAGLSASDIGVDLISQAFNSRNGKLIIPSCIVTAEQEGVHSLFRGAIAFFKNPCSHRTVNYEDRLTTIQTIAFAELLLKIVSTSKPR